MALRLYRCYNPGCEGNKERSVPGFDFASEKPVCPKCGIDQKSPRVGQMIQTLTVVHFDPPSGIDSIGCGHAACSPTLKVGAGAVASGSPSAVSCPECRKTKEWHAANVENLADPKYDIPVSVTQAGPVAVGDN